MKVKQWIVVWLVIMGCIVTWNSTQTIYADEEIQYNLKINVTSNTVEVYERATDGSDGQLLKQMACSVDRNGWLYPAVLVLQGKEEWHMLPDNTFTRYTCTYEDGTCLCSVPYTGQAPDMLLTEKYNTLGISGSGNCVFLSCADSKWIYDQCAVGTTLEIYEAGAVGKETTGTVIRIPADSENKGWDPTDAAQENPWKQCSARIEGVQDIRVVAGQQWDLLKGVKAYDTCGNDITSTMLIMGNYDFNRVGEYEVTYYVKDAIGSVASTAIKITVVKDNRIPYDAEASARKQNEKKRAESLEAIFLLAIVSFGLTMLILRYIKKH